MNQFAKSLLFVGILMIAASPAFAVITVTHLQDADLAGTFASQQHVGEGRAGDGALTATYEVGVGGTMGAPTITADYAWTNAATVSFLMDYDSGTDLVTFSIDGVFVQETIVLSAQTDILLRVASPITAISVEVESIVVDGEAVVALAEGSLSHDILWLSGATIADGVNVAGTVKVSWSGPTPTGDEISFSLALGTTLPVPTEDASWGAIKALFN